VGREVEVSGGSEGWGRRCTAGVLVYGAPEDGLIDVLGVAAAQVIQGVDLGWGGVGQLEDVPPSP